MATTNFTSGTVIASTWLNDVDDFVYNTVVNVREYGALGNGTTDDTTAIQAAITAAEALVLNRFTGPGVTVFFPNGTYLISSTLTITTSNIYLVGGSPGGSMLYAPSSTFDLVDFDGSALALYSVGMLNMKTYTPGNATAGAHIRVQRAINSIFANLQCIGWYDGIVSDGCGKTYYDNIILSQENRTAATTCRYGLDFVSTANNNSDVHVSNYQVIIGSATCSYSSSVRGGDGIYFTNGHQTGGMLIQPDGTGTTTTASCFWNQVYFDEATATNVSFTGSSTNYRNFHFNNCYFRDSGGSGVQFNASSTITRVIFTGCEFAEHRLYGIYGQTSVTDTIVSGCIFTGNNTDNAASTGDIRWEGEINVTGSRFIGGGAAGTALLLTASSSDCLINGNSFASTSAGTVVADSGTNNRVRGNTGFSKKSFGQETITNPATTAVVSHNLAVTPSVAQISLTLNSASAGVTRMWVSNVTSTQFTINLDATPTTTSTVGWLADAEV